MDILETSQDPYSIKAATSEYILTQIIGGIGNVRWGFKVLILDQVTMRIIDAAVEMKDITNAGVSDVCFIDRKRLPLAKLDGIYFLAPTEENVKQIIADFNDGDEPYYKGVHLFFTKSVDNHLMQLLASDRVTARIKTFKEANIEHLVYDSQTFHFDSPKSFYKLYCGLDSEKESKAAEQKAIAHKLATVCTTLGEYPIIRFPRAATNCAAIASFLSEKLESYRKAGLLEGKGPKTRGLLMIVDRVDDLIAPLVHELTYQAMVQDLVKPENDVYKHKFENENKQEEVKEVILNDNDPIWRHTKSMHIVSARKWTADAYKKFKEHSKDITSNEKDLSAQLRSLPKFQMLKTKFAVHIILERDCMEIYQRTGLERLISLEQEIATGVDENLKKVAEPKDLIPMIQQNISKENKMRLLMMYYAANPKATELQKRKILEGNARLTEAEEKLISNWIKLKNQSTRQSHVRTTTSDKEWEYVSSRYLPTMYDIAEELAKGTLSVKDYPFVNPLEEDNKPLIGNATVSKRQKQPGNWDKSKPKEPRPRIIIFVVGGITYSEIRVAHTLAQRDLYPDVLIGSTHVFNPEKFMKQVGALTSGGNDPAYATSFIGKDAVDAQANDDE